MTRPQSLLLVAALVGAGAASPSARVTTMRMACSDGVPIEVTMQGGTAEVERGGKRYTLRSKSTSFTRKFVSPEATLIQDGQNVVFVSGDSAAAADCKIVRP